MMDATGTATGTEQVTETGQGATNGEFVLRELVRDYFQALDAWDSTRFADGGVWRALQRYAPVEAAERKLRKAVGL